jgi:hypothetical protein
MELQQWGAHARQLAPKRVPLAGRDFRWAATVYVECTTASVLRVPQLPAHSVQELECPSVRSATQDICSAPTKQHAASVIMATAYAGGAAPLMMQHLDSVHGGQTPLLRFAGSVAARPRP